MLVCLFQIMNSKRTDKSESTLAWILLFILSLIWGSSFILIKKALIAFTPHQVGAGRIVIAFIAFLPLLFYHLKQIKKRDIPALAVVGLCGSGIPAFLYAIAQTKVPSAIAGLLNALTPIFAFVLAVLFFGRALKWRHSIGITLSFMGTILIFLSKHDDGAQFPFVFGFLIVVATLCYGISANTVSTYLKGINPMIISTVSFVIIGPWVTLYLFSTDFLLTVTEHDYGLKSLLALLTLSLVGTFGANILFFRLIQMTDAVFASAVSFLTPLVALLWGYVDGEALSLFFFFALILIFSGVFMIKFDKTVKT